MQALFLQPSKASVPRPTETKNVLCPCFVRYGYHRLMLLIFKRLYQKYAFKSVVESIGGLIQPVDVTDWLNRSAGVS